MLDWLSQTRAFTRRTALRFAWFISSLPWSNIHDHIYMLYLMVRVVLAAIYLFVLWIEIDPTELKLYTDVSGNLIPIAITINSNPDIGFVTGVLLLFAYFYGIWILSERRKYDYPYIIFFAIQLGHQYAYVNWNGGWSWWEYLWSWFPMYMYVELIMRIQVQFEGMERIAVGLALQKLSGMMEAYEHEEARRRQ